MNGLPNNTIVTIQLVWNFIQSTGASGGSITLEASYRKDNSGVYTKIGENISTAIEDAAGTWQFQTVGSSSFIQARHIRTGSTSGTYHNSTYIKSVVVHNY